MSFFLSRRSVLVAAAATLSTPAVLRASENAQTDTVRRNASSFRARDWRDHFDTLGKGAILADITSRALHYWDANGGYRLFPSSVPRTEDRPHRPH